MEISCAAGKCEVAAAHTPMDIQLQNDEMSVCAYSGCWSGRPTAVVASASFLTYVGIGLPFSSAGADADISVTVETATRVATILVAGQFAHPATCEQSE